jgi:NADPH:quinone reductase-like Zn-dependent oxidoreductase
MQAIHVTSHGAPDVLKVVDLPVPVPCDGEVLVRVLGVSLNHLDLWVRRGLPGLKLPLPFIPGCDGCGEIVECGPGVSGFSSGDRVMILPGISSGTSAHDLVGNDHLSDDYGIRGEHVDGLDREFVAVESRHVMKLPESLDPIQMAAVPLVFITAWGALVDRAALREGETVLVLGGASGVGSAGIQIARDLGARVISTAGSEVKRAHARAMGAEEVFDHHDPSWPKEVKEFTSGRGVDVVFEHIGPATWSGSMRSLARLGRLVTCGGTTGPEVSVALPHLFMKNLSVLGSTMGPSSAYPAIIEKFVRGTYSAAVGEVLPLSSVAEAHKRLEAGEVLGKVVLTPGF